MQLIGATTTETGLKVCCEIDANLYPKGVKVTDQEMQAINLTRDEFHGEWNYTIAPQPTPTLKQLFLRRPLPARGSDPSVGGYGPN